MARIYYSVEELNALLPRVEQLVSRLQSLDEELNALRQVEVHFEPGEVKHEMMAVTVNKQFHSKSLEFFECLEELIRLGGVVKDLRSGVVDFYSKLNERDIFLCWQLGEKKAQYWHEAGQGKQHRRPVQELLHAYWKELKKHT